MKALPLPMARSSEGFVRMIFLRAGNRIYRVIGKSTLASLSDSLAFHCIDETGRFHWIQPEKIECTFFRGPVAEILALIFPRPGWWLLADVVYSQQEAYRAVPKSLWR